MLAQLKEEEGVEEDEEEELRDDDLMQNGTEEEEEEDQYFSDSWDIWNGLPRREHDLAFAAGLTPDPFTVQAALWRLESDRRRPAENPHCKAFRETAWRAAHPQMVGRIKKQATRKDSEINVQKKKTKLRHMSAARMTPGRESALGRRPAHWLCNIFLFFVRILLQ